MGGIYHAINAGIHQGTCDDQNEYTTIRYASDGKTCRFVISLLMDSEVPRRSVDGQYYPGWLISDVLDTIPLWMVEIDKKDFTYMVVEKYDPKHSKQLTRERLLKLKELYPDVEMCMCDKCKVSELWLR